MGHTFRVMLVDDHHLVRQGISALLGNYDDIVIVAEASDGEEAVQLTRQLSPEVILMDINMPKMNGIEATRIISMELPHTRIIGLSMHDDASTIDAMRDAGMEAFVTKGAKADAILAAIRNQGIGNDHEIQ